MVQESKVLRNFFLQKSKCLWKFYKKKQKNKTKKFNKENICENVPTKQTLVEICQQFIVMDIFRYSKLLLKYFKKSKVLWKFSNKANEIFSTKQILVEYCQQSNINYGRHFATIKLTFLWNSYKKNQHEFWGEF